ncbi:MAG: twin-arginine translocase subunit TatC [Tepidisphaeraceae bacterium]
MEPTPSATPSPDTFDPDAYRMTVGEHLEELRWRMLLGLAGFALVTIVCLIYGREVMAIFCMPLTDALQKYGLPPQLHSDEVPDVFMTFIKVSLISAAVIASPWMVYQLWRFVASGLYPNERRTITRYVPLSIGLLVSGMLFVYFLVLPWTLEFFIAFTMSVPLKTTEPPPTTAPAITTPSTFIQVLGGDPSAPRHGQIWFDSTQHRIKVHLSGTTRVLQFGANNLIVADYRLPDYIDLVVGMLLTFGICFQLPLVVLALARVGLVELDALRAGRRYVYFAMAILAAAITPGDVITASVLLMAPLMLLYELGIWLASLGEQRPA